MSNIEITIYEERPREFWADMGPFFARREVRREMPYLIDDDGYVWFVARERGQVVGFVSCDLTKSGTANIHGLYVLPSQRNNGIAEKLLGEALGFARGHEDVERARATASPKSVQIFKKLGFEVTGERGQYRVVEKNLG